eukprot:6199751-Pleurochrysis_carterae.AAC.4
MGLPLSLFSLLCAGDDDPDYRLQLLDEYLSAFEAPSTPPASAVATQPLIQSPRKVVEPFPASESEAAVGAPSHMVMVNWLLNEEPLTAVDELALNVLDHLLMGTTTAPLYKAMLDSGLGAALMGSGLSDELKQARAPVAVESAGGERLGVEARGRGVVWVLWRRGAAVRRGGLSGVAIAHGVRRVGNM